MKAIYVTGTPGLLKLIADSRGRNRGPTKELTEALDPDGTHVCHWKMPHNDVEWRGQWLIKVKDSMEPVQLWMDNGFDAFTRWTQEEEMESADVLH